MDFTTATDRLNESVSHAQMAKALGVSVQSIRQARLDRANQGYREPPEGWQEMVVRLARRRAKELTKLADEVERS